jgi:hypothetical protein
VTEADDVRCRLCGTVYAQPAPSRCTTPVSTHIAGALHPCGAPLPWPAHKSTCPDCRIGAICPTHDAPKKAP